MRQLHIALIFVVFVAATADSKTVLYGTQGLHDKTCPEIGKCKTLDLLQPEVLGSRLNLLQDYLLYKEIQWNIITHNYQNHQIPWLP